MLGDNLLRSNTIQDFGVIFVYSIVGIVLGFILLVVTLLFSSYTVVEFPTSNDGAYGFLMKSVQTRIPLSNSGGGTVSPPPYNPNYATFGVDPGAPINATAFYTATSAPFSTSRWWSRLASQKAATYTNTMPYTYSGPFNIYRNIPLPSFAFSIARPYSYGTASIPGTPVCSIPQPTSVSPNVTDSYPTFFMAPILWNPSTQKPFIIPEEMGYSVREIGNMGIEMLYQQHSASGGSGGNEALRIVLNQIMPYITLILSAGSSMSLNSYYRTQENINDYAPVKLTITSSPLTPPFTIPSTTMLTFATQTQQVLGGSPIQGVSSSSVVNFTVMFSVPVTVSQLADTTVIITTLNSVNLTVLPTRYYIEQAITSSPTDWMIFDQTVTSVILQAAAESIIITPLDCFVTSTSSGVLTYTNGTLNQPLIFIPSLSMLSVGIISGASVIPGNNYWLSPQCQTAAYIAPSGSFSVTYPLIKPPPFGKFDIYSAFDANSLKRLNTIFARDLQALYAIDIPNDSFYTSVRKIFTFAQLTYAVFNFPAAVIVNVWLPPLRTHLMEIFDALLTTNINNVRLGYSPTLFTVATGSQQYGESQNQMFGDNHVGQYGMLLFTYYILVTIQFDNTARRYTRDRYQSIMVDLMRDFAQPYNTDSFIPSMRHFDFGVGISWQTSSIIEGSSLQVAEVLNGYYACWLVSQLFGDNKLRDFYRTILSIELATHQEYRLTPLSGGTTTINQMITASADIFKNSKRKESKTLDAGFYRGLGTTVFLIQNGEIIKHAIRTDSPDYRYLTDNVNLNTVADFASAVFYRPMTPLTIGLINLTQGINLNAFQDATFQLSFSLSLQNTPPQFVEGVPPNPFITAYNPETGNATLIQSLENNPSSFITVQGAYSLSSYAQVYVTNNTWAGANLPPDECAVIPSSSLPDYLSPTMQFNKLGVLDSNTVYWMQFVITAYGPRG